MLFRNSLDKVVETYCAAVAKRDFTYNGKLVKAKPFHVSSTICREFTCHLGCGGCCLNFTLDWIPSEDHSEANSIRHIEINGKQKLIHTHTNPPVVDQHGITRCSKLDLEGGLCGIHGRQPFTCDFETLRFTMQKDSSFLGNRKFGRGWNYTRIVDGNKGALCEFGKGTEKGRAESIRKLKRLKEWADYFEIDTHLDDIIEYVSTMPLNDAKIMRFYPEGYSDETSIFE